MKEPCPNKEREAKKKPPNFSGVKVSLSCCDCAVTAVNLLGAVTWIEFMKKRMCVRNDLVYNGQRSGPGFMVY